MSADEATLGTQFIRVLADTLGYEKGVAGAERRAGEAGTTIESTFKRANEHVTEVMKTSKTAGAAVEEIISKVAMIAFPVSFAVGIIEMGKSAVEGADHIEHLSQQLGISTESLSRWEYAGRTVGVSVDDISRSVGLLARQMVKGTDETGQQSKALEHLGLSAKNSAGGLKTTDEMLGEIAERFSHMEDGPAKTAAAMELFGRSGKQMIPLLNLGKEGLDQLRTAAERAGYVLSEEAAKQAHQLSVQVQQLKLDGEGLARSVMGTLVPALTVLTRSLEDTETAAEGLDRSDDSLIQYFTRAKPFVTSVAVGIREVLAGAVALAKLDLHTLELGHIFKSPAENKKELLQILADYRKDIDRIGQSGVDALEGPATNPNKKPGTEATDAASEAVQKLNRSLELNRLQLQLQAATASKNYGEMERLAAAIRKVKNYDDEQAGGSRLLIDLNEQLAAANEHQTVATLRRADADSAATKQRERLKAADAAYNKSMNDSFDALRKFEERTAQDVKETNALQAQFEKYMLDSRARITESSLSGAARERAAAQKTYDDQMLEARKLFEGKKDFEAQFNELAVQYAAERDAKLREIDTRYANTYGDMLLRLIAEHSKAKDQIIGYAEEAARGAQQAMSDGFFDIMTGQFHSLGDVARNFLKQLERDIANFLTEQATKALLNMLLSYYNGRVLGGGANTFSNGGTISPGTLTPSSSVTSFGASVAAMAMSSTAITAGPPAPPSAVRGMSAAPGGSRKDQLTITLEPGLAAALVQSGADGGYQQTVNDLRTGGPLYTLTRKAAGVA